MEDIIRKPQPLRIDATKLITQKEYAKKVGLTPQRINQLVKSKELRTVTILGATLILMD